MGVMKTDDEKAKGVKVEVPTLQPETAEEHLEFGLAEKRKKFRMQRETRFKEFLKARSEAMSPHVTEKMQLRSTAVHFTELVLPSHANHMGNTFGGQIMNWMS